MGWQGEKTMPQHKTRTPPLNENQKDKVEKVMHEFKEGELHSGKRGPGKGPVVKSRKQAIAIALSEAGANRPAKGDGKTKNDKEPAKRRRST
jgi:hypothetical protein